jgi:hypothetical protein
MSTAVVVPSAGPETLLAKTLAALRRELPDAPLVVVDDRGGRPEVAATVRDHAGALVTSDGVGCGAARNLGAARTDMEWILFLDDDVVVASGVGRVVADLTTSPALTVVGALRAPNAAPDWLSDSYTTGSMAPTAARGVSAVADGTRMSCALALVRRSAWADAQGFPPVTAWGWEDSLFGLRVQRIAERTDWLVHDPRLCGVHEFVPTWERWLARQRTAGERLHGVLADLPEAERTQLLEAVVLGGGPRASVKRVLGRLPAFTWRIARGSAWRRAAASASFAAGYREAARAH